METTRQRIIQFVADSQEPIWIRGVLDHFCPTTGVDRDKLLSTIWRMIADKDCNLWLGQDLSLKVSDGQSN